MKKQAAIFKSSSLLGPVEQPHKKKKVAGQESVSVQLQSNHEEETGGNSVNKHLSGALETIGSIHGATVNIHINMSK